VEAEGFAGDMHNPTPGGNFAGVEGHGYAGIITVKVSGGGTSSASTGDGDKPRRRDPRYKPGFERIKKEPERKVVIPDTKHIPPRELVEAPPLAPVEPLAAPEFVSDDDGQLALQARIYDAQDMTDIERLLAEHDLDEQDLGDVLDILALMD
jgi:hypothetical protein